LLAALAAQPPHRVLLQTRSPLIERDIELLQRLGRSVIASITIETDDESVRRAFTPTSPSIARRLSCARRLREAGIFTQLAISPMLPNNAARFAKIADGAADRIIVDTYFDGDGSGGRRSRSLGIAELYARLGYAEWFSPGAEQELLAVLRCRLGEDRVLFSRAGFNAI
jgi:DNA repair photolyase